MQRLRDFKSSRHLAPCLFLEFADGKNQMLCGLRQCYQLGKDGWKFASLLGNRVFGPVRMLMLPTLVVAEGNVGNQWHGTQCQPPTWLPSSMLTPVPR